MFVPEGQGSLSQTDRPAMWCAPAAGSAQRPSAWCHSNSSWQDGSPGLQMNHETAETLCVLAWYVWRGQRLHRQLWAVYHAPVIHSTSGHLLASCPLEILAIDFTKNETASDGKEDVLVFTKFFLAIPTCNQEVVSPRCLFMSGFNTVEFHRGSSDQGENFESKLISAHCELYGIHKT